MNLGEALAWLDRHQNLERMLGDPVLRVPNPERMRRFMYQLGDPQRSVPVVHLTGTNGKTSTARALSQLFMSKGLSVGTFTSPHLERINERIMANLEPVPDEELAELLSGVALMEGSLLEQAGAERLNWFECLAAAGFNFFADKPVDVAVLEVGMGGRWDATNVADGSVAVITNISLDHTEILGPTRAHIAREKAGIVKPGATLVLGETDPDLYPLFAGEQPGTLWLLGRDFDLESNELAVGGRLMDLRTPGASYEGVYLPLHGRYQAHNFLLALVAAEAFFGKPLEPDLVMSAAALVRSPGRLEVVGQHPLVLLDGAKNLAGARCESAAVAEEFGEGLRRVMVVGMLRGKDAGEMLLALDAPKAELVVACLAPSPRTQPAQDVAEAARALGCRAVAAASVAEALEVALREAGEDGMVLVTGSLYVVGEARSVLGVFASGRRRAEPSDPARWAH
jgi:dihydrofolate synthase/folylpolyglutamate synthase